MEINIGNEINAARNCGVIHCHIIETDPMPLVELAPRFGLLFTSDIYREINQAQAEAVAKRVLRCDLAYDTEIMTEATAQTLASRFLSYFDEENTRYYTNGDYYSDNPSHGWNPATAATFDTGVLIISKSRVGCLWVEDED